MIRSYKDSQYGSRQLAAQEGASPSNKADSQLFLLSSWTQNPEIDEHW